MSWLFELHKTQPVARAIGALAFVCMPGMTLGLGTAGVLFAGIVVDQMLGDRTKDMSKTATAAFVKENRIVEFRGAPRQGTGEKSEAHA
jgi:putative transport protein